MALERIASQLISILKPRSDVVGFQRPDGQYAIRDLGLSRELVVQHLLGNITLGIFPIHDGNLTGFMAFDIDTMDKDAVSNLAMVLEAHGIPRESTLLEFSGMKGFKIWVPLDSTYPSDAVYWIAKFFAQLLPSWKPEAFPKQPGLPERAEGDPTPVSHRQSLIKLPLGRHRVSGKRSVFIRWDEFRDFSQAVVVFSLEDQLEILEGLEPLDPRSLDSPELGRWLESKLRPGFRLRSISPRINYLELGCVRLMEQGVPESLRNLQLFVLSRAYKLCGLDMDQARSRLLQANSKNMPRERYGALMGVLRSVYSRDSPFPSCNYIVSELECRASGLGLEWLGKLRQACSSCPRGSSRERGSGGGRSGGVG